MFHQGLKSLRLERKMTQQELGEALGIPRGTMAGYESLREPDVATLRRIADYFDVSVDYLVGATDVRQPARSDSFQLPQILITLTDLASSKASISEIMAALPGLSNDQLNRVVGYIQALRAVSENPNVPILEKRA